MSVSVMFLLIWISNVRLKVLFTVFLLIIFGCKIIFYFKETEWEQSTNILQWPVIVWWTPFTGEGDIVKDCGPTKCLFTDNRTHSSKPKALLFYGSSVSPVDLPRRDAPRKEQPLWCLLHEESPRNIPMLQHKKALSLFNISATFSRHSHFPLTLQSLPSITSLTESEYFVPVSTKNKLLDKLAPVVYVQSDCDTPSERDVYVAELMKYIAVDSYGACLQNKKLPQEFQGAVKGMHNKDFWHMMAQYKFTIAFENAVCEDYITEKLWRPLMVGSVPIYYGSPTVEDWEPNKNSVIKVSNYKSPSELAAFISLLNKNDSMYSEFLMHKSGKISNMNLITALESRKWQTEQSSPSSRNFVEEFECFVCQKVHEFSKSDQFQMQVTGKHYNCPPPVSPITLKENKENWWLHMWYQGKAEAEVLFEMVTSGNVLTHQQFYDKVAKLLIS